MVWLRHTKILTGSESSTLLQCRPQFKSKTNGISDYVMFIIVLHTYHHQTLGQQ